MITKTRVRVKFLYGYEFFEEIEFKAIEKLQSFDYGSSKDFVDYNTIREKFLDGKK